MAGEMAAAVASIQLLQALFTNFTAMVAVTDHKYPAAATVSDGDCFDVLVVGGGTAGSVIASRLSEDPDVSVLLIEAGCQAPLHSELTGMFPMMPKMLIDGDYNTTNDTCTAQRTQNKVVSMTSGIMLGGSSGLGHALMINGTEGDYALWAKVAKDSSWNYKNLQRHINKITNLGGMSESKGNLKMTKVTNPANEPYIRAFREMGYSYRKDSEANQKGGVEDPWVSAFCNRRQSAADAYLTPAVGRANLKVMYHSTVTRINFDGTTATGVQVTDASGNKITVCAKKEVILTAGVVRSAQILMLSGIGPADNLKQHGIDVVADLPVGAVLRDHPSAFMCYATEKANVSTAPVNYGTFPVPVLCAYKKDREDSQITDYQGISLLFPPQSDALLMLCSQGFKYDDEMCSAYSEASTDRNIWCVVQNLLHPLSTGNLTLQSADYTVQPRIYHGIYSNEKDLIKMAKYLQGFHIGILNSTYFTSVGAKLVNVANGCSHYDETSLEFWKCFVIELSNTMWHYSSTCQLGTVTDSRLRVQGVSGVRVADAAAMPGLTSGNIQMPIMVMAEKAAEMIRDDMSNNYSARKSN